jgi:hypothetical protein
MYGSYPKYNKNLDEERLPLFLQTYEEERPSEPETHQKSGRSKNICNGMTMIIARWPGYITGACICVALFLLLLSIAVFTLLLISTTKSNVARDLVTKRESALLDIETHCHYQHEEHRRLKKLIRVSNYNSYNPIGFQTTSSFETERNDISTADLSVSEEHKVFFVTANDILSSRQLCAIESAARIMSNYNIYVIIILINGTQVNRVSDKRFDGLLNLYPNVKLFRLKGDKYFHESPMRDILHNSNFSSSLIEFAARVLTLWRYGGITYDLDLITLDNTPKRTYPIPNDGNVMISNDDGAVMSAAFQCHEYLYKVTRSLTSFYGKQHGSCHLSSKDVIKCALKKMCYDANKKFQPGTRLHKKYSKKCKGISAMPHYMICKQGEETNNNCIWASSNATSHHFRKKLCPVSYQHTSKQTSKTKRITPYQMKHIYKYFH